MAGTSLAINQYPQTVTLYASNAGIRAFQSFSVFSDSASATVRVFLSGQTTGTPFLTIAPGQNITFPCQATAVLSFVITGTSGDGSVAIHADSNSLSSSSTAIVVLSSNQFQGQSLYLTPPSDTAGYIFVDIFKADGVTPQFQITEGATPGTVNVNLSAGSTYTIGGVPVVNSYLYSGPTPIPLTGTVTMATAVNQTIAVTSTAVFPANGTQGTVYGPFVVISYVVTSGGGTTAAILTCQAINAGSGFSESGLTFLPAGDAILSALEVSASITGGEVILNGPIALASRHAVSNLCSYRTVGQSIVMPSGTNTVAFYVGAGAYGSFGYSISYDFPYIQNFGLAAFQFQDSLSGNLSYWTGSCRGIYQCYAGAYVTPQAGSAGLSYGIFGVSLKCPVITGGTYGVLFQSFGGCRDQIQGFKIESSFVQAGVATFKMIGASGAATSGLTVPSAGANVTIPLGSITGPVMVVGDPVVVWDPVDATGFFGIVQAASATSVTVKQGSFPSNNTTTSQYATAYGGYMPGTSGGTGMGSTTTVNGWYNFISANEIIVDGANGNVGGAGGFLWQGGVFDGGNYFRCQSNFGAFATGLAIASENNGYVVGARFDLAIDSYSIGGQSYNDYAGLRVPYPFFFSGNRIDNLTQYQGALTYAAATAGGATGQATFNGGEPVYSNKLKISFTFPAALAPGSIRYFYVPTPFALGEDPILAFANSGSGLSISSCQDASNLTAADGQKYPGQMTIGLYNGGTAAVGSGTTYYGTLEVGR